MANPRPLPTKPHVWVVEMLCLLPDDRGARWEPCNEAASRKTDAGHFMFGWRARNPGERFRVAKYERVK